MTALSCKRGGVDPGEPYSLKVVLPNPHSSACVAGLGLAMIYAPLWLMNNW